MSGVYTENSIFTPERLDMVRMRTTAFFNSTGIEGLLHQAIEIICNAIDEIALMPLLSGSLCILLCVDGKHNTYQMVVKDSGRGLPIGKLLDSYTKLNTSGKFDTNAYEHSGGLFGNGAKASAGTSRHFRGITHRPEGSASIYVHEGKTDEVVEQDLTPSATTGVTVIYEPDPICFPLDIPLFSEEGQVQLLTIVQKYCFFRRLNIEFRVYPLGLPATVWTCPLQQAEALVDQYFQSANVAFTEADFDRKSWIRTYFGVHRPFSLQHTLRDAYLATVPATAKAPAHDVRVSYEVQIYTVKFETVGGRFGMMNNNAIDDAKSTHFLTVMDLLKLSLSQHIKDAAQRKFFLEQYRLSVFLAVDVKFPGAEPSGLTKHAFLSRAFRNIYEPSLQRQLATPEGTAFVEAYYKEIAADIETKYMTEMTSSAPVKNFSRLFELLPDLSKRYKPCGTTNRRLAELFLVEGDSAGSSVNQGRTAEFQGTYLLGGKPMNALKSSSKPKDWAIAIRNNDVYKEILAITGINPARFDPNTLNYGIMNIMTDADVHGYHIAALLTGNFYALCPDIITSGMLHVVTPPLYSLSYTNRKNVPNIYFRDEPELRRWMITQVYMKALDVGKRLKDQHTKTEYLRSEEYIQFLNNVIEIGDAITNVAAELVLDPTIVERLTHVTEAIDPTRNEIDLEQLKTIPNVDRVSYEPNGNILILAVGRDDYIIPLQNVWKRLIDVVIPLINRIQWRNRQIYITTKNTSEFKDYPVSIMKLYSILQSLNKQFTTNRYKGLGSMKPADMKRCCMDPELRTSHQITSVGDVDRIFALLGSNSGPRKQLISRD